MQNQGIKLLRCGAFTLSMCYWSFEQVATFAMTTWSLTEQGICTSMKVIV